MENQSENYINEIASEKEIITKEELILLEQLFKESLPESPIDISFYEKLSEENEDIKMTLDNVLSSSLTYTEDIANLEKTIVTNPGVIDDDREQLDEVRTRAHNAVIDNINIFVRTLRKNNQDVKWFNWSTENRVAYKKFAVLLTLNRFRENIVKFREEIIEEINKKIEDQKIDTSTLKLNASETQLLVINYIEVLIDISRREHEKEPNIEEVAGQDQEKLVDIEAKLSKNRNEILSAFYRISLKR